MSVSWIDVVEPIFVAIFIIAVIYLFSASCHRTPFTQLRRKVLGMRSSEDPRIFVQVLAWSQILLIPLGLGLGCRR